MGLDNIQSFNMVQLKTENTRLRKLKIQKYQLHAITELLVPICTLCFGSHSHQNEVQETRISSVLQ